MACGRPLWRRPPLLTLFVDAHRFCVPLLCVDVSSWRLATRLNTPTLAQHHHRHRASSVSSGRLLFRFLTCLRHALSPLSGRRHRQLVDASDLTRLERVST